MLGAIIGDIVGSKYEFNPTNNYDFELFPEGCNYTDDTICTVAVADALLQSRDFGECLHDCCRRFPCAMGGYGGSFRKWVMSDDPQPYESFGNGSAMRVSPVAWFNLHEYEVIHDAVLSAECTHNHEEGIRGAIAVALAIHDCRGMFRGKQQKNAGKDTIMMGLKRALEFSRYNIDDIRLRDVQNKFDETCQGTVPVALWIISNSKSFEDAIRKAVSLGGDADTLGAIVGSIAEAIWGIPQWMKKKAMSYLPAEMQAVVKAFRKHVHGKFPDPFAEMKHKEIFFLQMYWKLVLGNAAKAVDGKDPLPDKATVATKDSWEIKPMPDEGVSKVSVDLVIPISNMEIIRKGHIPEAMEDHWFMYCDDEYIRYYRSWTGKCCFEAHYEQSDNGQFHIDSLTMNHDLAEFGVNGNESGVALFQYLIASEVKPDDAEAWRRYIDAWETAAIKYAK